MTSVITATALVVRPPDGTAGSAYREIGRVRSRTSTIRMTSLARFHPPTTTLSCSGSIVLSDGSRNRPAVLSRQCLAHRYLVPPGDGVLRKAVQAERQPYSGALLQHLEAQPVGRNELGLHIRHPAYRPDPTIPRRRHRPADQWRSERRRDPCTFRLGCHAPLGLTADAERPPAEEIMSIGGAHGARRGTGPTYLDCPFSRGVLYLPAEITGRYPEAALLAPVTRRMSA